MTLSPVKHLSSVLREIQNAEIREFFKDVTDSESDIAKFFEETTSKKDLLLSSSPGRASLKLACTIKKEDSMVAMLTRAFLFYVVLGAAEIQASNNGETVYYGIPTTHHQEQRRFQPQISLWFQEDAEDIDPDYSPVEGEISFRIMNKTAEEITDADIREWANKIKQVFGEPRYVWRKGKEMVSYCIWSQGYQLQMLCRTKADGIALAKAALEVQGYQYQRKSLNYKKNEDPIAAYPTIPPNETRRGKIIRTPRKRPIADVKFQHALLHLHGEPVPIVLVDYGGRYPNPVIT